MGHKDAQGGVVLYLWGEWWQTRAMARKAGMTQTKGNEMKTVSAIPLVLSVLVGLVVGLVAWGTLRLRLRKGDEPAATHDWAMLGLLVLAAFAMGAFVTYALVGLLP